MERLSRWSLFRGNQWHFSVVTGPGYDPGSPILKFRILEILSNSVESFEFEFVKVWLYVTIGLQAFEPVLFEQSDRNVISQLSKDAGRLITV